MSSLLNSFSITTKEMAKFDKIQVLNKMQETGRVPVFYQSDVVVAKQVGGVQYLHPATSHG